MTVTRFGSAQPFLSQCAYTASMPGIYSDQDSIPTPPFRPLPSTQRCDKPRLTAVPWSGSERVPLSNVGLITLLDCGSDRTESHWRPPTPGGGRADEALGALTMTRPSMDSPQQAGTYEVARPRQLCASFARECNTFTDLNFSRPTGRPNPGETTNSSRMARFPALGMAPWLSVCLIPWPIPPFCTVLDYMLTEATYQTTEAGRP